MTALETRAIFGHGGNSLEAARTSLGVNRPASVRTLAELYRSDVVLEAPLDTAGGVALGGHQRLTVSRDGSYTFEGHFRATGFPSYDVALVTTLGFPIVIAGAPNGAAQFAFTARGRVSGTNEPGQRQYEWLEKGKLPQLQAEWHAVRTSRLSHKLHYDTDWFGPAGDIVGFVAQVVALGAIFGASGVAIVVAGAAAEHFNVEHLVLPGIVGVIAAGGASYLFGPRIFIPVFIAGAAATAVTVKQRKLYDDEQVEMDKIFKGKVPYDRVLLTNLVGWGGRPFTAPGPGGAILVNLGSGYEKPLTYTGKGGEELNVRAPGQLLAHELTHAWQIANESFTPEYYCRAMDTAAGTAGGNMSAYVYGNAGGDWHSFNTEQQAKVVDDWYAGKQGGTSMQSTYDPMDEVLNPYYMYIRDHIRTGIG